MDRFLCSSKLYIYHFQETSYEITYYMFLCNVRLKSLDTIHVFYLRTLNYLHNIEYTNEYKVQTSF